ncbi:MAG: acetylxylan esterase [Atopobium sp.]|uniref:acetylxylan esterase n=1 Tax=Atopobium sp. TaxID=1872650 RepID=UPI002A74F7E0|nr:acetylxylan esterase [Atopobium sp.]MDY2788069.1 acetylxylan esterase [Atopobium sp.]MDY4523291.1 acetylxylan esterase [Atopobium sp.]
MLLVTTKGPLSTNELEFSLIADYAGSCDYTLHAVYVGNQSSRAQYEHIAFVAMDGTTLRARMLTPKDNAQTSYPTIMYFHDISQGPRGWAHLTRWVALGYRVVMLEQRLWSHDIASCGGGQFLTLIKDSVLTFELICRLPQTKTTHIAVVGEGTGAGLALDLAGIMGCRVAKLALLNPCPTNIRHAWQTDASAPIYAGIHRYFRYTDPQALQADKLFEQLAKIDCMTYAPQVVAPTLFGIGQLGQEAQVAALEALYNLLGSANKKLVSYPKWGYERINDFEDEILQFIHFERKDS